MRTPGSNWKKLRQMVEDGEVEGVTKSKMNAAAVVVFCVAIILTALFIVGFLEIVTLLTGE